jgi:hypothetical protein
MIIRTERFDDYYYPCMGSGLQSATCIYKWLILFVFMHKSIVKSDAKFDNMRE